MHEHIPMSNTSYIIALDAGGSSVKSARVSANHEDHRRIAP